MNAIEISELTSSIFKESRSKTKFSQEYMAKALGVSKKTVIAWESGDSSPNLSKFVAWFDVLGVPIYPYMARIAHPELSSMPVTDSELNSTISKFTIDMTADRKNKIIYELLGSHGSDPSGLTEMITAYLHLPLEKRVVIAKSIATAYMICEGKGSLLQTDQPLPDIDVLRAHCIAAMDAVMEGKETYILEDEDLGKDTI